MYRKVVDYVVVGIIGEYGIIKVKEKMFCDSGTAFKKVTVYDVCLEHGEGDIVASFDKISAARKWAKEN